MRAYGLGLFSLMAHLVYVIDATNCVEELTTHNYIEEDCRKVEKDIKDQCSETVCKSRKTLVQLKFEPGYTYYPKMVLVNRCHGLCSKDYSCLPVAKNYTTVFVKRLDIYSLIYTCHRVFIEEHNECKCKCKTMREHCKKYQKYDEDECACKCANMEEKQKCIFNDNMRWDPETCSCICSKEEDECSTGLEWVPRYCKCIPVMDGDKVMYNFI